METSTETRRAWPLHSAFSGFLAVLILLFMTAPVARAQSPQVSHSIESFGQPFAAAQADPVNQARVYVYRVNQGLSQMPVNIYLDGNYHASLLRGGYTDFCVNFGSMLVKAALNDASRLHLSKVDGAQRLTLQGSQSTYLRVNEKESPVIALESVPAEQALAELAQTRQQIHTISRAKVARACVEPQAPPAAEKPEPPRLFALETDALFEFGKAELRASGFNAIENLVQVMQKEFSEVDRIRVVGFTDAIGPTTLNKRLSRQRAEVVAQKIAERQIPAKQAIEAEGRGASELAKTGCANQPTPENKTCHAPNRRVVVVVTGVRRPATN